jgi:hypothetical protein
MVHISGRRIFELLQLDVLLGLGLLILHRYDVHRVLIWFAFGWFVLDALLLGYRGGHL